MSRKPESVYNDAIREALESAGAKCLKLHGSPFMKEGNPDIIGAWYGFIFVIETKLEGEEPKPKQSYELRAWERVDAITLTATRTVWQPYDVVEYIRTCITDKIWWHRHGNDNPLFPQPGEDEHICLKVNNEGSNSSVGTSESRTVVSEGASISLN